MVTGDLSNDDDDDDDDDDGEGNGYGDDNEDDHGNDNGNGDDDNMRMITEINQAVINNLHHRHHQEPEDDHDNDEDRSSRPQRWRLHPAGFQLALHLPVLRLSLLLQDLLPHLHPRPLPRPPRPPRPPLPHRASPQLKTGA